jgi:2-C-methyl-D-erythritol 4-phosphate cytidylyltransferase
MDRTPAYWAIIPAAGTGTRMGTDIPKQYLKLAGKCILEHSAGLFCNHPKISGVVVALANDDPYWNSLTISSHIKIRTVPGGKERSHSVRNGLIELVKTARPDDWVLVHDAARPCLHPHDIDKLINQLSGHAIGGILAIPVKDTMKRSGENNEIAETVNRQGLWHALTPQMFRVSMLKSALDYAREIKALVTDEAQAMEIKGMQPVLVEGRPDNIKVTRPDDLSLAEYYKRLQEKELCE